MEKTEAYNQYIQSRQWKIKRLEKAKSVKFICELCGKEAKTYYEIHHKTYQNFTCEKLSDLMFLCKECHKIMHEIPWKDRWNLQENLATPLMEEKRKRECKNCKYSILMKYGEKRILYCNKRSVECTMICAHHHYGEEKTIEQDLTDSIKRPLKKKKKGKGKK